MEAGARASWGVITAVSAWATAYEARLAHAFEPEQGDRPGSFSEALSELDREFR